MRSSIRRTWRSVTFNRLAAATCVRCFCFTSCNTFNRSRSRWLKAMRSVSMGPSANHESGHFYFAQTGHSHFAATLQHFELTSYKSKSSVRVISRVIARAPWIYPHSLAARYGLAYERIWISSFAAKERGDSMKRTMRWVGAGLVFSLGWGVAGMQAQQPVGADPQAPSRTVQTPAELVPALPVPRLVKFAGTLKDELGKPRTGVVGATFAVYKEQEGVAALWLETQNLELDEQGHYTVLLGTTKSEGLPLELFSAGESRWLGVQVNLPKEVEQPRVLLVSVPYALKAADAETLGGKPLSSFVLANPASGGGAGVGTVFPTTGPIGTATIGGGGAQNFVAKFDVTGTNVVNSTIFDTGTNVGIGTTSPARTLHLKSAAPTIRLEDTNLPNSYWELQQSAFVLDTFGFLRYENGAAVADKSFVVSSAGNLGIGTGTPQRKLHIRSAAPVIRLEDTNLPNSYWELQQSAFVLDTFGFLRYENGAAVQSKSFVMSSAGNFGIGTGTPTQKLEVAGNVTISGAGNALTFPDGSVMSSAAMGVGGGTITGVAAGTGLTGGGTTGGVVLNNAGG